MPWLSLTPRLRVNRRCTHCAAPAPACREWARVATCVTALAMPSAESAPTTEPAVEAAAARAEYLSTMDAAPIPAPVPTAPRAATTVAAPTPQPSVPAVRRVPSADPSPDARAVAPRSPQPWAGVIRSPSPRADVPGPAVERRVQVHIRLVADGRRAGSRRDPDPAVRFRVLPLPLPRGSGRRGLRRRRCGRWRRGLGLRLRRRGLHALRLRRLLLRRGGRRRGGRGRIHLAGRLLCGSGERRQLSR